MRYAIYYLPDPETDIAALGARWLGRDIETGRRLSIPADAGTEADAHERLVAVPRRYGFHATLKAPFRLAEGRSRDGLVAAFRDYARSISPVRVPVLSLARLRRFFALVPAVKDEELQMLASDAEHHFEPFRAPLTQEEFERRRAGGLSDRQNRHLERYGYPFVLDEFRFHLTLTAAVEEREVDAVAGALERVFQPVLGRALAIDRIALVVEPGPAADFTVLETASIGDPLAYTRRVVHAEAMHGDLGYIRPQASQGDRNPPR